MNIEELKTKKKILQDELLDLLRSFEDETGAKLTSLNFERYNGSIRMGLGGDGKIILLQIGCEV